MVQLNKLIEKLALPPGPDLWVSAVFICFTISIAEILRALVNVILPGRESFARKLALEFIASAELCAACFEICIVADNYGIAMYAFFLFFISIWWSLKWGDATACPYDHIEDYILNKTDILSTGIIILVELVGGCLVYPYYVSRLWELQYENRHVEKVSSEECWADLQISPLYGALVEAIGTCLCQLTAKLVSEKEPAFGNAINAFVGTSMVVAAWDLSGGYYSPVLATALQYGCTGANTFEHVSVYWMGPIFGSLASVFIFNHPYFQDYIIKGVKSKLK